MAGHTSSEHNYPMSNQDRTQAGQENKSNLPSYYDKSSSSSQHPASPGAISSYQGSGSSSSQHPTSPGTTSSYQGSGSSSSKQSSSPGAAGRAGVGEGKDDMNLVDERIRLNNMNCLVVAKFICGNEEMYALESDKPMSGFDGLCPKCRTKHAKFNKSNLGFYAPVKSIHDKIHMDRLAAERSKGPKEIERLLTVQNNLPPLDHPILGVNKGIEGDSNSCYMDATIFCMFAYSNVFDSLLNMKLEKTSHVKKLQKLLKENIVHVLRSEIGFVERDALFHLRALLSETTGDASFREMEKDPSEFLRAFERLFQYVPVKTLPPDQPPNHNGSNMTTNIIWEMFDANPHKLLSINIASIFRNSLSEIPAKLATIPPVLVLVAPRHTRSQRSYRYIIPDCQIILDNNIVQLVCLECKKTNRDPETSSDFYSCDTCFSQESPTLITSTTDATIQCYCTACLSKKHKNLGAEFPNHNLKQVKVNKHKLNLFAVLCIETSHYVAFVKCQKQTQQHEWLFFDSMSDRIHNEKNVPCVSRVPNFDQWIIEAENEPNFFEDLDRRRSQGRPTSQAFDENGMRQLRLFRDGAFFFYENSSSNYQ